MLDNNSNEKNSIIELKNDKEIELVTDESLNTYKKQLHIMSKNAIKEVQLRP